MRLFLLVIVFGLAVPALAQKDSHADSVKILVREDTLLVHLVDSLKNAADQQHNRMLNLESRLKALPETDSLSKRTLLLKRNLAFTNNQFDSTLVKLDSCVGVLNLLNARLEAIGSGQKSRPEN